MAFHIRIEQSPEPLTSRSSRRCRQKTGDVCPENCVYANVCKIACSCVCVCVIRYIHTVCACTHTYRLWVSTLTCKYQGQENIDRTCRRCATCYMHAQWACMYCYMYVYRVSYMYPHNICICSGHACVVMCMYTESLHVCIQNLHACKYACTFHIGALRCSVHTYMYIHYIHA